MKKILITFFIFVLLFSSFSLAALATGNDEASEIVGDNIFENIYDELLRHSDKILAGLAFLGSALLAFAYKKGMLPILKGGISTLSSAVSELKEATEKSSELGNIEIKSATEKLGAAENMLSALSEKLTLLSEELEAAKEEQSKASDLKIIMQYQIDMLYEIFMSSSIPVYQKEAVGEKISMMKKLLSVSEEEPGCEN